MRLSIGSTIVSYLQSDNMALAVSPTCGNWMSPGITKEMLFAWAQSEEDAAGYYQNCYEADPSVQECNIYANNGPLSNRTDDDDCQFQGDVCLLGPHSAITLDTGYIDANTLGINSQKNPSFSKKDYLHSVGHRWLCRHSR
jgi:hypothetical protein